MFTVKKLSVCLDDFNDDGVVQWMCPHCGCLHGLDPDNHIAKYHDRNGRTVYVLSCDGCGRDIYTNADQLGLIF